MATLKLTDKAIAKLVPPTAGQDYYSDSETTGFGLVIGHTGVKSFVARAWIGSTGKRRRVVIGHVGAPCAEGHKCEVPAPCGHVWNVAFAKNRAKELLGMMARGIDPSTREADGSPVKKTNGPTLRDAYDAHVERLRKKGRSEATIKTLEKGLPKYLGDWMDKPIAELRGSVLVEMHAKIKQQVKARAGSNPLNETGAPIANRVIAQVSACWNTLNKKLEGGLGTWNPAKSVERDQLKPKRERITNLKDWYKRVQTMRNPIQRDGLLFALFTGLRNEEVRSVRFEHADLKERTLLIPDPKGGESKAFTIPLAKTCIEIIKRRQKENAIVFTKGDGGFVFPGQDSEGNVGPIGDLRQQLHLKDEDGEVTKHMRFPAEDVHTLRRTFESVAHEEGISELDTHVLSNHSFASHNVNATYIAQHMDHLRACVAKIEAGLQRRLGLKK